MDADFIINSPFRLPQWRAERVMRMLEHRPSPLRARKFDDCYVRTYRNFLVAFMAAGDNETERYAATLERPHAHHAHMLHYHPDIERRDILQARLLTGEPLAGIAKRFATGVKAIEFYDKLFFDIRDRLHCKDWIAKVILDRHEYLAPNTQRTMTEDQRGFLYKLFAFHGGALVLDTLIGGIDRMTMPQRVEDVGPWFDEALGQFVRSRAVAAAQILEVSRDNVVQLLKLALRQNHAEKVSKSRPVAPPIDLDAHAEKVAAAVEQELNGWTRRRIDEAGQAHTPGSVEPPVSERSAVTAGQEAAAPEHSLDPFIPAGMRPSNSTTEISGRELETLAI